MTVLAASAAFAMGGAAVIPQNSLAGYLAVAFFGFGAVGLAIGLVRRVPEIQISAAGIKVRSLFRQNDIAWSEVSHIYVDSIKLSKVVRIVGNNSAKRLESLAVIVNLYEPTPEKLCEILSARLLSWKDAQQFAAGRRP